MWELVINGNQFLGVMLSLARYRLTLVAQLFFLSVNGLGLLLGSVYNSKTPDLYEKNLHHSLGWIVTSIITVQCIIGFVKSYALDNMIGDFAVGEQTAFIPSSVNVTERHQSMRAFLTPEQYRYSRDSGQGTEPSSSRSHSISSRPNSQDQSQALDDSCDVDMAARYNEKITKNKFVNNRIMHRVSALLPTRVMVMMNYAYDAIDRLILLLGFVIVVTGAATYGGVFVRLSFLCISRPLLINNSAETIFSMASHILSKVAYFFGTDCSLLDDGWAVSLNLAGHGIKNPQYAEPAPERSRCHLQNL